MGLETMIRLFAVDNTGKKHYTEKQIHDIALEELRHEITGSDKSDTELEALLKERGIPAFLEVRNPPDEECKKYKYLPYQKEDPFKVWIDTASGNEAYEIAEDSFVSDFEELYTHMNLEGVPGRCAEITAEEAEDMLTVLDYILRGKYNRDIEEVVFRNNEYFKVFEDQFFNFSMRFRKTKKSPQQIVKIVIDDKRAEAKYEDTDDDYNDDSEVQAEREESVKNERFLVQRFRDFLSMFFVCKEPSYIMDPKIKFKLGYFLSY